MRRFNVFEFSSNFIGKNEFYHVSLIEVNPLNDEFVMFFMHDPFIEY
jgi:hypothetical protein